MKKSKKNDAKSPKTKAKSAAAKSKPAAKRSTAKKVAGDARISGTAKKATARKPATRPEDLGIGCGRELFGFMRAAFSSAEQGASAFTTGLEALQ